MTDSRAFWLGRARAVAWRHNSARWLDLFLPASVLLGGGAAAALLLVRQAHHATQPVWWTLAGAWICAGLGTWLRSRGAFLERPQALVRLDEAGSLHNRLISAWAGVGEWPASTLVRDPVQWNWRRIGGMIALIAFLLVGASLIQLPVSKGRDLPTEQPIAWSQVDSWIETLQDSKLVEPETVEKLQSQLNELRSQPQDKWYEQSSLEAGDSLRQQTESDLRSLQQELQKAESAVSSAADGTAPPEELKEAKSAMEQAMQAMEMGNMPVNRELMKAMKQAAQSAGTSKMNPEEMKKLQEQLKQGTQTCNQCVGPSIKKGEGEPKEAKSGGKGGGGETAPLALKDEATDLHSKKLEGVKNQDQSRLAPGEVVEVTPTAPDIKPKPYEGAIDGGTIVGKGQGGEAVWKDSVTPRERDLLQRYFK